MESFPLINTVICESIIMEQCAICGCILHRKAGTYGRPTVEGRSHATKHHFVAERFFGRSANRQGTKTEGVFASCPWSHEGESAIFCYECHEELLHNPVLLPQDIAAFADLVRKHGLNEDYKSEDRKKLVRRIMLFHEIIATGIIAITERKNKNSS